MKYTYKEIKSPSKGLYREKGSKFISYSFPLYLETDVKDKIDELKKIHQGAQHFCYAYIINPDKSTQRSYDDGEPSSTAGKPILGQITSNDLTNILIVVIRYYGGVKLGIRGLIRSYKTASIEAIRSAQIITKTIKEQYEVIFKYPQMNIIMRIVKEFNLEIIDTDFKIECKLIFTVPKNKKKMVMNILNNKHQLSINYIKTI